MQPTEWRVGRIRDYRLRFNLEGWPRGRAAPANISPEQGAEVWGVLYSITRRELVRLDASEGVPGWRYQPLWLEVEDARGTNLAAVTYIADGNVRDGRPSLRYIKRRRRRTSIPSLVWSFRGFEGRQSSSTSMSPQYCSYYKFRAGRHNRRVSDMH
jgi:gamma-glutamylcyclotransferase (GGCT)/AIG2-like uncharacterized protein YtfP